MNILIKIGSFILSILSIFILGNIAGKKSKEEEIKNNENEKVVNQVAKFNEYKINAMDSSDSVLDSRVQKWNKARDKAGK